MAYSEHLRIPGAITKFRPDKECIISRKSVEAFPMLFTRLNKT